ncbi:MAG TPA: anti-sigma regulatory factor [Rudaea sp.]|jgi:serine/threonine-protein kinase RsbT|nr:anti-sigma regulatory factor [Rudaea sp.]
MTNNAVVPLQDEQDVVRARQAVRIRMQELKFSLVDQTKMITAASELARNTVIHGKGGEMGIEVVVNGTRTGVRLTFEDHGPGIEDLDQAMTDGWTSGGGLGMGLPGTKRLVNDFHIESTAGQGTKIVIARWK